jgi:hypothetical protein
VGLDELYGGYVKPGGPQNKDGGRFCLERPPWLPWPNFRIVSSCRRSSLTFRSFC